MSEEDAEVNGDPAKLEQANKDWVMAWIERKGNWATYSVKTLDHSPKEAAAFLRALADLVDEGKVVFSHVGNLKLTQPDYYKYIQSDEWKEKAETAKRRADYRCQVCYTNTGQLDTHHRTYERLGREHQSDLIVLCHECHGLFHQNGRLVR